jgi:hypothetical protein
MKNPDPHVKALLALIPAEILLPLIHGPAVQALTIGLDRVRPRDMKFLNLPKLTKAQSSAQRQQSWTWRNVVRSLWIQLAPRLSTFDEWCHTPPVHAPRPPSVVWSEDHQSWFFDGLPHQRPQAVAALMRRFLDADAPGRPPVTWKDAIPVLYPHGIQSAPTAPLVVPAAYSLGISVVLEFIEGTREITGISTDRPCILHRKGPGPTGRLPYYTPVQSHSHHTPKKKAK